MRLSALLKGGPKQLSPVLQPAGLCTPLSLIPTGLSCLAARHAVYDATTEVSGGSTPSASRPYTTHTPLGVLQKSTVAVLSAAGAVSNPARADLVAALGETTGYLAFAAMRDRMQRTEAGRLILSERPRITNQSVSLAWDLRPSTFGGAYAKFMGSRKFEADERPPVRFVDDEELAFVAARSREVHDLWHVLFGCPTTVLGELALKAVEFVQTGLPMAALSVLGAQWRLKPVDRSALMTQYLPWAMHAGSRCPDLITLYYEKHFEDDLEELRDRWRILTAPAPAFSKTVT